MLASKNQTAKVQRHALWRAGVRSPWPRSAGRFSRLRRRAFSIRGNRCAHGATGQTLGRENSIAMTIINAKRRREVAQEAKKFGEAYKLASAYGKAGNTDMAKIFINSVKISKASETTWLIRQALRRMHELAAEDNERREQGLPRPEYIKPQIH